jgi:hypothetical protein
VAVHIRNISTTEEAGRVLRRRYDAFRPLPGDTFALLFVSEYFYSDGSTVEGFRPGYMAGPITTRGGFGDHWALAQLSDGLEFYFMPQFVWDPMSWYLIDKHVGFGLYSIEPAAHR